MIYFPHIFWGNSSYSNKEFTLQKKIFGIIMNTGTRDSCMELFKDVKILPMHSQYIYPLILYTVHNEHLYNKIRKFINIELGTILILRSWFHTS